LRSKTGESTRAMDRPTLKLTSILLAYKTKSRPRALGDFKRT